MSVSFTTNTSPYTFGTFVMQPDGTCETTSYPIQLDEHYSLAFGPDRTWLMYSAMFTSTYFAG